MNSGHRLQRGIPTWQRNPEDVAARMSAVGLVLVDDIHPEEMA